VSRGAHGTRVCKIAIALLFLLLPAQARAQQVTLTLDPAQTTVSFTLDAFLHIVHGTMKLTEGHIAVDPVSGIATGAFTVDARSAETGNSGRDNRMHKEILESARYPEISFTPMSVQSRIAPQGASQVQLRGLFRIHGHEETVTLPVDVQLSENNWTGETTFVVPYVKWGIKNPSNIFLHVKDSVTLTVKAAGRVSAQP
jgi:polyisoprenoid-binding protein YceI